MVAQKDAGRGIDRVLLIGFSGTGKSTTGRILAEDLGWSFLEMDSEIERRAGMAIPEIFERQGEASFRDAEAQMLREALDRSNVVVSTGGGAVCSDDAWNAIHDAPGTLVVGFDAPPEELLRRIERHAAESSTDETTKRPMLDAADPLARVRELLTSRQPFYRRADITIPVQGREPGRLSGDICELVRGGNDILTDVILEAPSGTSLIQVGPGARTGLLEHLSARWPKARRAWIGTDAHVAAGHRVWLDALETEGGFEVSRHTIPSGESSKSLTGLGDLYDWMIGGGVERNDVAVAVGGGVTGDLMGFAAATTLRGIGLVQIPTTLLSMVDSSVGGKTGINHAGGKNLIGAFYQPPVVLVDPMFLRTLPERELRAGFAEVIKHGVIQPSTPEGGSGFLLDVLALNTDGLLRLAEPLTSWVIRQNISLKAAVVEADERESHLRQILNFGHTIGHGIEAAGYALLHGEAVAVGMVAAMSIAVDKGLVSEPRRARLVQLIQAFGLPVEAEFDPSTVREKMARDKKKQAGTQRWVLPLEQGGVDIRTDVDETEIARAIEAVRA